MNKQIKKEVFNLNIEFAKRTLQTLASNKQDFRLDVGYDEIYGCGTLERLNNEYFLLVSICEKEIETLIFEDACIKFNTKLICPQSSLLTIKISYKSIARILVGNFVVFTNSITHFEEDVFADFMEPAVCSAICNERKFGTNNFILSSKIV